MDKNITGKNYNSCCRTCLNDRSEKMYDILEHSGDSVNIAEILSTYTSIRVAAKDQLPKKLCSNCYHCLLSFHNFTNNALHIDKRLKEYYSKTEHDQVKQENKLSTQDNEQKSEQSDRSIEVEMDIEENTEYNNFEEDNIDNSLNIFTETKKVVKQYVNKLRQRKKIKSPLMYDVVTQMLPYTDEYNCTQCTAKFKDRRFYIHHMMKHNQETKMPVTIEVEQNQNTTCDVCSITFNSTQSLSAHKKVHITKGRILQCKICNKIFKKFSHLKRHELSSAHKDNRPHKCSLCKKSFATEESLASHVDIHSGVKKHHCPICRKMFNHVQTLKSHIKVHTQGKPYLCPTCGKMFDSSNNLKQHMRRHTGEKLFPCSLCPKKFISKGELKTHTITHSGEKSHACEQCNRMYKNRKSLDQHKLTHLGVKPHHCDVCTMKFVNKDHLKRHYRTHTGEKPYRCEICERAFTQSNDLLKHKRTHLGNNLYKCDECSESFRLKNELRQHISDHFVSKMGNKLDGKIKQEMSQIQGKDIEVV